MNVDLAGKKLLITGGSRGIGRAISLTLARAGATVGVIYRADQAAAERTLADLLALGTGHFALRADIAMEAEATAACRDAGEKFGGAIDFLVLDAAVGGGGPMTEMKTDDWKRPFDVNVHGAFYMVRETAPMLRRGGGIVFLSSGAGHDPIEGLSAYGASKAAVNQMAAVLAQELGPRGIRVNVVSPGHTDRGDSDPNLRPESYTPAQKQIAESTALRRIGAAQDVANVVLFFVSDLSGFVTGQWLRVNGGRV